jgi:hypothetical protein
MEEVEDVGPGDGQSAAVSANQSGGNGGANGPVMMQANSLLQDLTQNERCVHADFDNKFGKDLFDDKNLE